jgi:hypothetical protein
MLSRGGVSITQILTESELSPQAKDYFLRALEYCEGKSFGKTNIGTEVAYQAKYFNELIKKI